MNLDALKTLFDSDDYICMGDAPTVTSIHRNPAYFPIGDVYNGQFFCINPLRLGRADSNVTVFRNILLEFDQGSIEEQTKLVLESGLPFTTMTFSGNKSIHVIISLETPCPDRQAYNALVARLYKKFPTCDPTCKNPSRLSRTPGATRDTGRLQGLLAINGRVSADALETFLGPAELPNVVIADFKNKPKRLAVKMHLNTMAFLHFGAPPGSWNISLFKAAADLYRCGLSKDEIRERLEAISGYLDHKDNQTIASAFRAVEKE